MFSAERQPEPSLWSVVRLLQRGEQGDGMVSIARTHTSRQRWQAASVHMQPRASTHPSIRATPFTGVSRHLPSLPCCMTPSPATT